MTQSGASQAVQQLEDFLQVQLLDRSKRPFVVTSEGELFYSGCCKLVRQFDNLAEEVRSLGQEISGRATIAAIYSVGLSYLPDLQRELKARYPKTEVRFQFCHPEEVYRAVEQGSVDFGLVSYPQQSKSISATHWRDEPMVLAAPAAHAWAKRPRVTPEDLGLESLIAFAPNLRIRHEIDRYLRSIGITMPIAAEFDNVDSVKHALDLNGGVAFLPRPAIAEELESGTLVALKCDWLTLQRPLGVIQRRDTSLGRTARAFYELMFQQVLRPQAADADGYQAVSHDGALAASAAVGANADSLAKTVHAAHTAQPTSSSTGAGAESVQQVREVEREDLSFDAAVDAVASGAVAARAMRTVGVANASAAAPQSATARESTGNSTGPSTRDVKRASRRKSKVSKKR